MIPRVSFEEMVVGKEGRKQRRVMARPVRFLYLQWPAREDGKLRVRCWMHLRGKRLICGGEVAEGYALTFYLPAERAESPKLEGLCSFRYSHRRALWFAERHKRIRALLPPIVRLAFDRWYGP